MQKAALALDQIRIDVDLQPRVEGLDETHVRALQDNPGGWPPIVVVPQGRNFVLVDGFHRFAAAQNLGLITVDVDILDAPEDGDLHSIAFALNAVHGRPLTLQDRRAFAARLLGHQSQVSNMETARRAGLSPTTVASIRERLESENRIAPAPQRLGADGVRYPAELTSSVRATGQLPPVGIGASVGETLGRLFTPAERVRQRRIAQYLERLSVALGDQDVLEGWDTADDAAEACRLVLGPERAAALSEQLGMTSGAILDVAISLGYVEEQVGE